MSEPKIILLCSSRFAIPAIRELHFYKLLSAVVIPGYCEDMLEQSAMFLKDTDVAMLVVDKENCDTIVANAITEHSITMGVVMSFPYKITAAVFNLPQAGFFNVHPGPLPAYRGADPVFQQIRKREKYAGVTIHKIDEGLDTGALVLQEMIKLEVTDTYGLLTTKLSVLAGKMTGTLTRLASMDIAIPSRKQDETKAVYYKKQLAKDITINWNIMDAVTITALANACNPWNKGVVTKLNGNIIRLLEVESMEAGTGLKQRAGTIVSLREDSMLIATLNDEAVKVKIIYIEEGFLLPGRLRGLGVAEGNCFEMV